MESRKSFAAIHDDYAFFLAHTNQEEALSQAVADRLASIPQGSRILDYGCGRGAFLDKVLTHLNWQQARLTLVDPDPKFVQEAAQKLARFQPATSLEIPDAPQDIVLAAECLYYVKDLKATLDALLAPGGTVLIVLGGRGKITTQIRQKAYQTLGMAFPFYLAEDIKQLLPESGRNWTSQHVPSTLAFPDTLPNRLSLLRFLLGDLLSQLDQPETLLDPYVQGERLVMEHYDWLFEI